MLKKIVWTVSIGAAILATGCAVLVSPPPPAELLTTIETENNLTSMSVDVNGSTTNVAGIDLEGVTVGDVFFSTVPYGTTSAEQVTNRSGNVSVDIGTAVVFTQVLDQTVPVSFSNISSMSATITPGIINTVIFDQSTAGVIFQVLAKKTAVKNLRSIDD
jgi:hypothetical protein